MEDDNTPTAGPNAPDTLHLSLPANLLAQIDAQVGGEFVDRQDFIRSAVRHYLEHIQHTQATTPSQTIG